MNHVHKYSNDLVCVMIKKSWKKYKWRVYSVLWYIKTDRLGKKSSCPKAFTWQNYSGTILNILP